MELVCIGDKCRDFAIFTHDLRALTAHRCIAKGATIHDTSWNDTLTSTHKDNRNLTTDTELHLYYKRRFDKVESEAKINFL